MALILCVETSTTACSVALSKDGELKFLKEDSTGKSHSAMLLTFIDEVLKNNDIDLNNLDAFAVSKGPGSYTGLRIGVSTIKGLAYATEKPVIAVDTLQAMALGMKEKVKDKADTKALFCPLIDARRMEVYSAVYNFDNEQIRSTMAEIVGNNSFQEFLTKNLVYFAGDALQKCKEHLSLNKNTFYIENFLPSAQWMCKIVEQDFLNKNFVDTAYFEPFYLKDFVAGKPKIKGLK